MKRTIAIVAVVTAAGAGLFAGCGGGSTASSSAPPTPVSTTQGPSLEASQAIVDATNRESAAFDSLTSLDPDDPQKVLSGAVTTLSGAERNIQAAINRYGPDAHPCVVALAKGQLKMLQPMTQAVKDVSRAYSEGRLFDAIAGIGVVEHLTETDTSALMARAAACKDKVGYKGLSDPGYAPR